MTDELHALQMKLAKRVVEYRKARQQVKEEGSTEEYWHLLGMITGIIQVIKIIEEETK